MIPILTIDGPSGSGKGTVAQRVASRLGWHVLDSGSLYRIVGYLCHRDGIPAENAIAALQLISPDQLRFEEGEVCLQGEDITAEIRTEEGGRRASQVATNGQLRSALLDWQRGYAQPPGLVADGRDMGTVVFPDAPFKVFLTASAEERAKRRYKQLKEKGISASLPRLAADIRERDERDASRAVAPLIAAEDAVVIDSSNLSIEQVVEKVLERLPKTE